MDWLGLSPFTWATLFCAALAALAFLPTIVAACRHVYELNTIIILNLIVFIIPIAWPVILIAAFAWPKKPEHLPGEEIIQKRYS